MKSYKTFLFILSLAVGLVALACFFPSEGIYINKVRMEFPSMSQVLKCGAEPEPEPVDDEEPEPELTPEELMEQRMAALHASRDSEFVAAISGNRARFYLPDDDVSYFDTLFSKLEQAERHPVRIMHFGDSQLEGDRMTGVLREWFQDTFSGRGPGLVPAMQTLGSATVTVTTQPELPYYMGFGSPELRADHNRYGPLSQMAVVTDSALFTVAAHGGSTYPHCRSFRRVSALVSGEGRLSIQLEDNEIEMTSPHDSTYQGFRICSASLPSAMSRVSVRARGNMEVYGLMADGSGGVSVDNIAMRGASGSHFSSLDRATFAPFFQSQDVALIILQYGGNSIPYLRDAERISGYKRQIKSQISYLRRLSPQSTILFIGPTDMATAEGDEMQTYPQLPQTVDSLRAAALESGAAFWDMFRVMGGRGSMARWVEVGLAGEDYIHFSLSGSRKMSELLCQTFDFYYRYYRFRNALDQEELTEDTLTNDTTRKTDPVSAAL